jgi:hypothetical protein
MKSKLNLLAGAACALLLAIPLTASASTVKMHNNMKPVTRALWPAESLSGKITMVDPDRHLVVVQTADGIPFDMLVTPRTRIESSGQHIGMNGLSDDMNRVVSIRFTPERRGDILQSLSVNQ